MIPYIDGFVFPIQKQHLETYKAVAEEVAKIWKAHGAISYQEFIGDDLHLDGTISFKEAIKPTDEEVIIFGWVSFPSKTIRDKANVAVPKDEKMAKITAPLNDSETTIFDASRMIYGGFNLLHGSE